MQLIFFFFFFYFSFSNEQEIVKPFEEYSSDSLQIQIKVSSLFNFHCIYDNEQFCHPYYILSFSNDETKTQSPSISCTRNPIFPEKLTFSPHYCENILTFEFYQLLSFPVMEQIIKSNFSQILSFENLKNIDRREILSFTLQNIPIGSSSHFLMLKTIDYDVEKNKKYILPACVSIEFEKKNGNCFPKETANYKKKIKGARYCKEEFSQIFFTSEKILSLDNSEFESECKEKRDLFQFNENLEMRMYALVLNKYCQILEKNVRNLYFFLHYHHFLKIYANIFRENLENFEKEFENYPEIAVYLKSKTYEISFKENSRYLNDIIADFLMEKDKYEDEISKIDVKTNSLKQSKDIKKHLLFKEIFNNFSGINNQTKNDTNGTKSMGIIKNMTNETTNYANSSINSSNLTQIFKKLNITSLDKLIKILSSNSSFNLLRESPFKIITTKETEGFTDDKIFRQFQGDFCPNDSICLLKKDVLDFLSSEIIDEYLMEESNNFD